MTDIFLGEIKMVGYASAPVGWLLCNGQLLDTSNYSLLFSLISTTFGGDGVSTFALPDFRGRSPMDAGQGPGLTDRSAGDAVGSETVVITEDELPSHNHRLIATNLTANSVDPQGRYLASPSVSIFTTESDNPTQMGPESVKDTSPSNAHNNIQPRCALSFIISISGVIP